MASKPAVRARTVSPLASAARMPGAAYWSPPTREISRTELLASAAPSGALLEKVTFRTSLEVYRPTGRATGHRLPTKVRDEAHHSNVWHGSCATVLQEVNTLRPVRFQFGICG